MVSSSASPPIEVFIVGAGPTGLVLALWLQRLGVRIRIIDRALEAGTHSRALAVQARTLELYTQLGLADEVVRRGHRVTGVHFWLRGEKVGELSFGEAGANTSPFPYALIFPQDEHERLLIDHLSRAGVRVERGTELLGFTRSNDGITLSLRRADGTEETCTATYLAGCDGAHSAVRQGLGSGFSGGTYSHLFYVADTESGGALIDGGLHVALDDSDFLGVFPMKGSGRARLIGTIEVDPGREAQSLGFEDVSRSIIERTHVEVRRVNWFSTYRVHHRVADRFSNGPVFLLGDAAHIHSPVGGQGMNTGIGDAINLAWKLEAVLRDRATPALLETYDTERRAFAESLVATTDRLFQLVTSEGTLAREARTSLAPRLFSLLSRVPAARRALFRVVSQTRLNYRKSPLSSGRAGRVRGGDRLPWVKRDAPSPGESSMDDNFFCLRALAFQVHVYGEVTPALERKCGQLSLPLHVFPWSRAASENGLSRGALYLVRPDGYVALADAHADPARLEDYCRSRLRGVSA